GRHRFGHFDLTVARFESRKRPCQRAVGLERGACRAAQLRDSGYSGNFRHNVSTFSRTPAATVSLSAAASTVAMNSAIASISGSRIPRLVIAGVPILMPLATIGGFLSNGMAFLFTVIPALPSAASAT